MKDYYNPEKDFQARRLISTSIPLEKFLHLPPFDKPDRK
jgi:hypothetical protein